MTLQRSLGCRAPGTLPILQIQKSGPSFSLGKQEVLVQVHASSVNPIDAKRANGYGRRLLSVKGASRFPLVLGNDFVGTVLATGSGVDCVKAGDSVWGLKDTGPRGTHTTTLVTPDKLIRKLPAGVDPRTAVALPYTFTTLWHALHGCGLDEKSAKGAHVLIHGASGGLGQLALQLLGQWGAKTTAICSTPHADICRDLGANQIHDRLKHPISRLPMHFDAVLNFGSWQDDADLATRLKPFALGHATTVHPLMDHFDRYGWLKGARQSLSDWRRVRRIVTRKGASTRYAWTIFKPDPHALDVLQDLLIHGSIHLPIGVTVPLDEGARAFRHVSTQSYGRAVLIHDGQKNNGDE